MHNLTLSQLISFLENVQSGHVELASFLAKKVDHYFEVEIQFKGTPELPFEDENFPEQDGIEATSHKPSERGMPKDKSDFIPHEVRAVVILDSFNSANSHFIARVISQERKLTGTRPITIIPDRNFADRRLLALACSEQVEVDVEIYNTVENGKRYYFLKKAEIKQLDLFNDLINYVSQVLLVGIRN